MLKGNEDEKLVISFAPRAATLYDFKIKIRTYPVGVKSQRIVDARQLGTTDSPELLQTSREYCGSGCHGGVDF